MAQTATKTEAGSSPQSIPDVLEAAADLLSKPGAWTQGAYARGKGNRPVNSADEAARFCVLGAMNIAAGAPKVNLDRNEAHIAFANATGIPDYLIATWNDTPGRTQDEVVAKLREAAALARTGGEA